MHKLYSWCITHTHTHTMCSHPNEEIRKAREQKKTKPFRTTVFSFFVLPLGCFMQPPFKHLNTIFRIISYVSLLLLLLLLPFWLQLDIISIHFENRLQCSVRPWISLHYDVYIVIRGVSVSATHYTIQWLPNSKLNAMKFPEIFRWTRLHAAMQFSNAKFCIVKYL